MHYIHAFWGHSLEGNKQIVLKPGYYLFHSITNASMTPKNIFSSNSKDHDDESFHVEEKEGVIAVAYGSKNLQQKKW